MPVFDYNGTSYPEIKPIWDVDTAARETGNIWEGDGSVNNLVYTASVPITVLDDSAVTDGAFGKSYGYDNAWVDGNGVWLCFRSTAYHRYYLRMFGYQYRTSTDSEHGQYTTLYHCAGTTPNRNIGIWLNESWPQYNGVGIPRPSTEAEYPRQHFLITPTSAQTMIFVRHRGRCDVGASSFFSGRILMLCDVEALNPSSAADAWNKLGQVEFTGMKEVNG